MDKIFKNKFENFEKKVPNHILESILNNVSVTRSPKPSLSLLKVVVWTVLVTVAALIVFFVFIGDNQKTDKIKTTRVQSIINSKAINTTEGFIKNPIQVKKQTSVKSVKIKVEEKQYIQVNPNHIDLTLEKDSVIERIRIKGLQYVCNQESFLELDHQIEGGKWFSDKDVFIETPNNSKTIIRSDKAKKVLFTFVKGELKDTFTVFFNKPLYLEYKILPETCLGNNGALIFEFQENRNFYSTGTHQLNDNQFSNLEHNTHYFELKDQYNCEYNLQIDIPLEHINGHINYNAQETKINSPIYFEAELNMEELSYKWDFGDGTTAYNKEPNHTFKKVGEYSIKLILTNDNCIDTIVLRDLVITDGSIKLPNIFTPNNDGKNDIFKIKTPDDLLSFEALIISRSGKLVYKWTDPAEGWDGLLMNGEKAKSGSYYCIIKGLDNKGKEFEYKSYLVLSR